MDRIAEIFCGAVKGLLHGRGSRMPHPIIVKAAR